MKRGKNAAQQWIMYDSIEDLNQTIAEVRLSKLNTRNIAYMDKLLSQRAAGIEVYGARKWLGCDDMAQALERMKKGWPEMLTVLRQMMKGTEFALPKTSNVAVLRRRKRVRSDYGDTLHMPRVWSGDLEHAWDRPVKVPRIQMSERYATLFLDLSAKHTISFESLLWRAAACILICDLMQRAGRSVEIWVGASTTRLFADDWAGERRHYTGIRVKEFRQPLNETRMATVATATFLRTMVFASQLCEHETCQQGMGLQLSHGLPQPLEDRKANGELVFRLGLCTSREDAIKELEIVRQQLMPQGEAA